MKALFIVQNDFYLLFEWREKHHYFSPLKIVQRRSTRVLLCISPFFHIWWTRLEYQMDNWTFFCPICITIIICPCIEMDRGDVIETFLWITREGSRQRRGTTITSANFHTPFLCTQIYFETTLFFILYFMKRPKQGRVVTKSHINYPCPWPHIFAIDNIDIGFDELLWPRNLACRWYTGSPTVFVEIFEWTSWRSLCNLHSW